MPLADVVWTLCITTMNTTIISRCTHKRVKLLLKKLFTISVSSLQYPGVFIDYYGGEAQSHIVQYAARLYFVCEKGTKLRGPVLEHLKGSYQAHIRFFTEHVC